MPNYSFRCDVCGNKRDEIVPYEESNLPNRVKCECGSYMKKHFGNGNQQMMIVPPGNVGNSWNGYTSRSQTKVKKVTGVK
jgi:hypothetical protein